MMRQDLVETDFLPDEADLLPENVELFVIGDVHGRAWALARALEYVRTAPVRAGARKVLVHAGDVLDRGPQSLQAMRLLVRARELSGADEVHLLQGNHELMLMTALCHAEDPALVRLWTRNGGETVLDEVDEILDAAEVELRLPAGGHHLLDNHWAWIRKRFLAWERGWDGNLVVHGHTVAFDLVPLWHDDDAAILKRMDETEHHRRINVDAGAAYREFVGGVHLRAGGRRIFVAQPEA